jgi:hypothetical protein
MFFSCFVSFFQLLIEYSLLFLFSFVKINFIWRHFPAHLTVFQGAMPCFIGFNFFTFFYFLLHCFKGVMVVFKLPSILGGFCFYALRSQKNLIRIFLILSFIFFIFSFFFIFYFEKNVYLYIVLVGVREFSFIEKRKTAFFA